MQKPAAVGENHRVPQPVAVSATPKLSVKPAALDDKKTKELDTDQILNISQAAIRALEDKLDLCYSSFELTSVPISHDFIDLYDSMINLSRLLKNQALDNELLECKKKVLDFDKQFEIRRPTKREIQDLLHECVQLHTKILTTLEEEKLLAEANQALLTSFFNVLANMQHAKLKTVIDKIDAKTKTVSEVPELTMMQKSQIESDGDLLKIDAVLTQMAEDQSTIQDQQKQIQKLEAKLKALQTH